MGLAQPQKMSASEYLAWEREQTERHEYVHGEVFAMTGGTVRHSALAAAIIGELHAVVRKTDCRLMTADQRVVLLPDVHYVYPDVTLVCGPVELVEGTSDVITNPSVVIEVLSPSTEAYDRGDKWAAYQQVPSLREYVLVSQSAARIEVYRRDGERWQYEVVEAGGRLKLLDRFELDVDAIYEGVFELPGTPGPERSA